MTELTLEEKKSLIKQSIQENPFLLIEHEYLQIKDKKRKTVFLKLNKIQKKIHEVIVNNYNKKPIRIMVLKARKEGVSTYVEGVFYALTSQLKNAESLIIANEDIAANNIFEMSKFYHESLINTQYSFLAPTLKKNNAKMLEFEEKNSKILVKVASGSGAGRSFTFQFVHASEVAFFKNPKETFTALNNSVPKENNTIIILESTANGVGNHFHQVWKDEKNDYIKLFFAWFDLPDNKLTLLPNEELVYPEKHYKEITDMKKRYNLSDEQIKWYINTLLNECSNDIDDMKQEHPSNPDEAFLASGTPIFNSSLLYDLYEYERKMQDSFVWKKYNIEDYKNEFRLELGDEGGRIGEVEVYQLPTHIFGYAMFCDIAEGVEGGDYSVCNIFNIKTGEQVLNYRFDGNPIDFAHKCYKLAKIYNDAIIVPERNNNGGSFITALDNVLHYGKIYKFPNDDKLGFPTTIGTRTQAINYAKKLLNEGYFKLHSLTTISEMLTFVTYKGKMQASKGNHDDEVTTLWIAGFVIQEGLLNDIIMNEAQVNILGNRTINIRANSLNDIYQQRYNQKIKRRKITGY